MGYGIQPLRWNDTVIRWYQEGTWKWHMTGISRANTSSNFWHLNLVYRWMEVVMDRWIARSRACPDPIWRHMSQLQWTSHPAIAGYRMMYGRNTHIILIQPHTVLQSVGLSTSATLCPGESWKSCWRCFIQSEFWHTRQVAQVIWHMPLMGRATQCPACMHHHASLQFYPIWILVPLLGGRVHKWYWHMPLMGRATQCPACMHHHASI